MSGYKKNNMSCKVNFCLLYFTIIIILPTFYSCTKHGRWSKEWEEKFESFQPSDKIMDIVGVRSGMHVGEIGAGNGRFAVKVAATVGNNGMVYANDIDPRAIRFMKRRCKREQIDNMKVIQSDQVQSGFPKGKLDIVYLINTYDHLTNPVTLLRNTLISLKPDGRLAVISYDPDKLQNHKGHAVSMKTIIEQCRQAGFELVSIDKTFLYDNVYVFKISESR